MRRLFPWSRPASGLFLALWIAAPAIGQDAPAPATTSTSTSLGRYAPAENLRWQIECDGVDAHADAWRKTAAYRILNDTPTGEMLASVIGQWVGPRFGLDGARAATLLKHLGRSGFLISGAVVDGDKSKSRIVVVVRNGFSNRDVKPILAQLIGAQYAPDTKAQAVVKQGHKIYTGKSKWGWEYSWWVEESKKEDIVFVFPTLQAGEMVLETLDGKQPSSLTHPARVAATNAEAGFEPFATLFIDPSQAASMPAPVGPQLEGLKQFDIRWGFQGDALQTVMRLGMPSPRKGALAILDGPSFDKASFPPIPDTNTGFAVTALDTKAAFDQILALAGSVSPAASNAINGAIDSLQSKSKIRFREDFLGHLGPKMAVYGLPTKSSDAGAPPAAAAIMGALGMNAGVRGAVVFEVDDPVAFGKALDEVMVAVNREIKAYFARTVVAPPAEPNAPPNSAPARRGPPPAPEFRLSPTPPKAYIFAVPPELSKTFPPSLRPSVRLGTKHVVFATSSDAAREAAEPKGLWTPPVELADAHAALPGGLKWFQYDDNRDANAATLASFPAKIQILANSPLFRSAETNVPPTTPPANAPAASSPGGMPGMLAPPGSASSGGPATPGSASGMLGGPGPGQAPGAGGANPGTGAAATTGANSVIIRVPPEKLPSADALKGMMFGSMAYVSVDSNEVRVVTRVAFPDVSGLSLVPALNLIGATAGGTPPAGRGVPGAPGAAAPGATPGAAGEAGMMPGRRGGGR